MSTRSIAAVVGMMLATSVGTALFARHVMASNTPSAALPLVEVTGTVRSVDAAQQVITLLTAAGEVRIQLDDSTTIFVSGRTGQLEDLAPGATVRATFEAGTPLPVAQWIEVPG